MADFIFLVMKCEIMKCEIMLGNVCTGCDVRLEKCTAAFYRLSEMMCVYPPLNTIFHILWAECLQVPLNW